MQSEDKLVLVNSKNEGERVRLVFASYLRDNFVERSLSITMDKDHFIEYIYFNSYKYGSVEWENGSGLINCHIWENEDQAKSDSYLSRRYTAILSNGAADNDYAYSTIIPDILNNMKYTQLAAELKNIVSAEAYLDALDLKQYSISIN